MNVVINGTEAELREAATVADAAAAAGVEGPGRGVAVAVEGEVVPRAEWEARKLREGESVEVVHAVQGG
jgi:sulfur carrier protein